MLWLQQTRHVSFILPVKQWNFFHVDAITTSSLMEEEIQCCKSTQYDHLVYFFITKRILLCPSQSSLKGSHISLHVVVS